MGMLPAGSSLYDAANISLMHHVYAALRAHMRCTTATNTMFVQDGEVVIVDEFTGRLMSGRRWSDGLHQAVEAKEGVPIQRENQTLASITFQNYFRMYGKRAGMTGTGDTRPTSSSRFTTSETVDHSDASRHGASRRERPVLQDDGGEVRICRARHRDCYEPGQPVLVGTTSIENSGADLGDADQGEVAASGAERQSSTSARRISSRRPVSRR